MTTSLTDSYDFCRSLARQTAGNFYFSFLTLPADRLKAMCVLYAFMRLTDDLGDDQSVPVSRRASNLAQWRKSLRNALDGRECNHAIFPALSDVVGRYQLPPEHLLSVIDGVEMDLVPTGFETFEDLCHYCNHVAGSVGVCCVHLWGYTDERALESATDCGIAFQLTNILRDLAEDAHMGRVYLPRDDLKRFDYGEADIGNQRRDERFRSLMQFEIARAKSYYERAERLYDYLEPAGKPVLYAMLRIYRGLLSEIERRNYDVFSGRISLPRWRKLGIVLESQVRRCFGRFHRTGAERVRG